MTSPVINDCRSDGLWGFVIWLTGPARQLLIWFEASWRPSETLLGRAHVCVFVCSRTHTSFQTGVQQQQRCFQFRPKSFSKLLEMRLLGLIRSSLEFLWSSKPWRSSNTIQQGPESHLSYSRKTSSPEIKWWMDGWNGGGGHHKAIQVSGRSPDHSHVQILCLCCWRNPSPPFHIWISLLSAEPHQPLLWFHLTGVKKNNTKKNRAASSDKQETEDASSWTHELCFRDISRRKKKKQKETKVASGGWSGRRSTCTDGRKPAWSRQTRLEGGWGGDTLFDLFFSVWVVWETNNSSQCLFKAD